MKPKLSIVIVNWNGRQWAEKCLSSLASQTLRDFEVVFVDNGSTDDSVALVREKFPWVVFVEHGVNAGFAGGNAVGIRVAQADLLMLLNSDTWAEDTFLQRMLEFYATSKADVVAPMMARYDFNEPLRNVTTMDLLGFPAVFPESGGRTPFYLYGACLLFSRQLYEETGGLDLNFFMFFEETDWFWRMRLMGKTAFLRSDDVILHHYGAGSAGRGLRVKTFRWRNENNLQMLIKNYSAFNLVWVVPTYLVMNAFELLGCLLLLRPDLALTYPEGWWFNLRHLPRTLRARAEVQSRRKVSDREVVRSVYRGSAKIRLAAHMLMKRFKKNPAT